MATRATPPRPDGVDDHGPPPDKPRLLAVCTGCGARVSESSPTALVEVDEGGRVVGIYCGAPCKGKQADR